MGRLQGLGSRFRELQPMIVALTPSELSVRSRSANKSLCVCAHTHTRIAQRASNGNQT